MDSYHVPEKDIPGFNNDKRLGEDLHFKGAEKEFTFANFLKFMFQENC